MTSINSNFTDPRIALTSDERMKFMGCVPPKESGSIFQTKQPEISEEQKNLAMKFQNQIENATNEKRYEDINEIQKSAFASGVSAEAALWASQQAGKNSEQTPTWDPKPGLTPAGEALAEELKKAQEFNSLLAKKPEIPDFLKTKTADEIAKKDDSNLAEQNIKDQKPAVGQKASGKKRKLETPQSMSTKAYEQEMELKEKAKREKIGKELDKHAFGIGKKVKTDNPYSIPHKKAPKYKAGALQNEVLGLSKAGLKNEKYEPLKTDTTHYYPTNAAKARFAKGESNASGVNPNHYYPTNAAKSKHLKGESHAAGSTKGNKGTHYYSTNADKARFVKGESNASGVNPNHYYPTNAAKSKHLKGESHAAGSLTKITKEKPATNGGFTNPQTGEKLNQWEFLKATSSAQYK